MNLRGQKSFSCRNPACHAVARGFAGARRGHGLHLAASECAAVGTGKVPEGPYVFEDCGSKARAFGTRVLKPGIKKPFGSGEFPFEGLCCLAFGTVDLPSPALYF